MKGESFIKWFYEDPIDFESKKYRLLSCVSKAEKMIEAGNIHEAMDYVENHLVCFYKFKTEKELIARMYKEEKSKLQFQIDYLQDQNCRLLEEKHRWSKCSDEILDREILKAQKEISELKKNSISSIQIISGSIVSNIIENISGDKLNESSIKATVEDVSKKNMSKFL